MQREFLLSATSAPSFHRARAGQLKPITLTPRLTEPASRLWLAVCLPQFPLEVALRGSASEKPCVMVAPASPRPRILFANAAATRLGIRPHLPLGAAHALGDFVLMTRDTAAEQHALTQLAMWAYQFSPLINVLPEAGLVLEIQGSLKLFGGVETLLSRLRRELRELGYRGYLAIAPTPAAATALATARQQQVVMNLETLAGALHELPLEVLSLTHAQRQDLYAIGLRTLGDCTRLPRDGLSRRFTPQMLLLLDRLYGRQPDPRPYFVLPKSFTSRLELPWEVQHTQALQTAMGRLLLELTGYLRAQEGTTRELQWNLHQTDGMVRALVIGVGSASRDFERLSLLTRERLHRETLNAPVRALELTVTAVERAPSTPAADLFKTATRELPEDWPQFIARLRARLGERALRGLAVHPEHRPECGSRWQDPLATAPTAQEARGLPSGGGRPLWLTRQPIPLTEQDGKLAWGTGLVLSAERERIESGWWDGEPVARDYFVATDTRGRRWWVYKNLTEARGWYLHGIFE